MVALVIGASDGIGNAVARLLQENGHSIYGISQTGGDYAYMNHRQADVRNAEALEAAVNGVYAEAGDVDALVYCAGVSLASPAEQTTQEDARRVLDVNFFGCTNAIRLIAPRMKARGSGRILLISSAAGAFPIPFLSYYVASKAAMTAYGRALDSELRPYGLRLCVLLPGGVRTRFSDKRQKYDCPEETGLRKAYFALGYEEQMGLSAEHVASSVRRRLESANPPVVATVGGMYRFYGLLQRLLPNRAVQFFLRRRYGIRR